MRARWLRSATAATATAVAASAVAASAAVLLLLLLLPLLIDTKKMKFKRGGSDATRCDAHVSFRFVLSAFGERDGRWEPGSCVGGVLLLLLLLLVAFDESWT